MFCYLVMLLYNCCMDTTNGYFEKMIMYYIVNECNILYIILYEIYTSI